jgi:hypothetical protein
MHTITTSTARAAAIQPNEHAKPHDNSTVERPATERASFYTVGEAARLLRVDPATIHRAPREDAFPAIRIRSCYVIPAAAFDQPVTQATGTRTCVDVAAVAARRRLTREMAPLTEPGGRR